MNLAPHNPPNPSSMSSQLSVVRPAPISSNLRIFIRTIADVAVERRYDTETRSRVDEIDWAYLNTYCLNNKSVHLPDSRIPFSEVKVWLDATGITDVLTSLGPSRERDRFILDHTELSCLVGWCYLRRRNNLGCGEFGMLGVVAE